MSLGPQHTAKSSVLLPDVWGEGGEGSSTTVKAIKRYCHKGKAQRDQVTWESLQVFPLIESAGVSEPCDPRGVIGVKGHVGAIYGVM